MPQFTELYLNKPSPYKLTISPDNYFNIFVYYEMRGAGGGAGGGHTSSSYIKGGDGRFGTKVVGQMILKPGDVLFLCPGEGGKSGQNNSDLGTGGGAGGTGVALSTGVIFAGGNGGGAFGSYGAGGGGGAASVIMLHRDNQKVIAAVAAGGGGGGGSGTDPSITLNYPYIASLNSAITGGGRGQDHYDSAPDFKNYRNGSYLGELGPGGGGGGAGARNGNGGLIGFNTTSSAPGSGGTSFATKIQNLKTAAMLTDPFNTFVSDVTFLDSEFGGQGAPASNSANIIGVQGDDGYINIFMFPINTVRIKEDASTWVLPNLMLVKGESAWETVKKMLIKRGDSQWNVVYDTEVKYEILSNDSSQYVYASSLTPSVEKESPPEPISYTLSVSQDEVEFGQKFSVFVTTTGIPKFNSLIYEITGDVRFTEWAEPNVEGGLSFDLNEVITLGAISKNTTYGSKSSITTRLDYICNTQTARTFVFKLYKLDRTSIDIKVSFNPVKTLSGDRTVCISVIDESVDAIGVMRAVNQSDWNGFRSRYPNRPFILLQPEWYTVDKLGIPPNYDGKVFSNIKRDNGNVSNRQDWFDLINLSSLLPKGGVVSLSIDNSGSLELSDVLASYNLFKTKVAAAGYQLVEPPMLNERWVPPHDISMPAFIVPPPPPAPVTSVSTAPNRSVSPPVSLPVPAPAPLPATTASDGGDSSTGPGCAPGATSSNSVSCDAGGDGGDGGDCFTKDSLVYMADGSYRKIIDIEVGDEVYNYDKTRVNRVKFIEKVIDSRWEYLYSPNDDITPFATINHPIYIDGKLSSVDPDKCFDMYPWLGMTEKIINPIVCKSNDEYVYNLWVDGDGTYNVNDYGTTSIIGSGDFVRRCVENSLLDKENAIMLIEFFSTKGKYVQYGSYLLNKILGKQDIFILDKAISYGMKNSVFVRKTLGLCAMILGYIMHPKK